MEKIETARLVLRRPLPEDVFPLAKINADPEVMKYIGDGRGRTFEQTAEGTQRAIREWDRDRLAPGPSALGGFATEAAREALRFGFESCGFDEVISIRHVDNDASRRVMEKLGLHFDFQTKVPSHGQPVAVHSISRAEFDKLQP